MIAFVRDVGAQVDAAAEPVAWRESVDASQCPTVAGRLREGASNFFHFFGADHLTTLGEVNIIAGSADNNKRSQRRAEGCGSLKIYSR